MAARPEFRDGVVFAELGPVTDAELFRRPSLRRSGSRRAPTWERLAEHLNEQETLLVLDNFEHVPRPPRRLGSLSAPPRASASSRRAARR